MAILLTTLLSFCVLFNCDADAKPSLSNNSRPFADKWAIVIGVDKFSDPTWNLKYAANDAIEFQQYLLSDGHFAADHVRLLTGRKATRDAILQAIDWLGRNAQSDDLALVFVRTRGTLPRLDSSGESYLAAADTTADSLAVTGFDQDSFQKVLLERIHSKDIFLIVDADFSGQMLRPRSFEYMQGPLVSLLPAGHLYALLCSSGSNEISWESKHDQHGVFTHCLVTAFTAAGARAGFVGVQFGKAMTEQVEKERSRPQHSGGVLHSRRADQTDLMIAAPAVNPHAPVD